MSSKFPWFPLVSAAAAGLGLFGLCWYENLTSEEKSRADALAADYAQKLYGRAASELTAGQFARINHLVEDDLFNGEDR